MKKKHLNMVLTNYFKKQSGNYKDQGDDYSSDLWKA